MHHDLISYLYPEYTELTCYSADLSTVTNIHQANIALEEEDFSFQRYDLALTDYEELLIADISIKELNYSYACGELTNFADIATDFVKSIDVEDENNLIAYNVGKLIARLTHNIMDASNTLYACALLFSDASSETEGKYGKHTFLANINLLPDWHIDKSFEEVLTATTVTSDKEDTNNIFLLTLKGHSTLYYLHDQTVRDNFYRLAHDLPFTYGSNGSESSNKELAEIMPLAKAYSVNHGEGTVHYSGKQAGTIHASPHHHERLLIKVLPGSKEIIERYDRFLSSTY